MLESLLSQKHAIILLAEFSIVSLPTSLLSSEKFFSLLETRWSLLPNGHAEFESGGYRPTNSGCVIVDVHSK